MNRRARMIILTLFFLGSVGHPINAMNKEVVVAQQRRKEIINVLKELPQELKLRILYLLLESRLAYTLSPAQGLTLQGHTGPINSVAFSPNGETILTGLGYRRACLWNSKTGELVTTLVGHSGPINSLAWSPDGKTIATGSLYAVAGVWDAATGKLLRILKGHTACIVSIVFSCDGKALLTGSWDNTVCLWSLKTGKLLRTFEPPTALTSRLIPGFITQKGNGLDNVVAYSPTGEAVVTRSDDGTAYLWNAKTGKLLRTLKGHTKAISSLAWSPDGKTIATGSSDSTVCVWNCETGELVVTLRGNTKSVISSVVFSADGETIFTGAYDGTIGVWSSKTGNLLEIFTVDASIASLAISPDDQTILICERRPFSGLLKIIELASLEIKPPSGLGDPVRALKYKKLLNGFDGNITEEQKEIMRKEFMHYACVVLDHSKNDEVSASSNSASAISPVQTISKEQIALVLVLGALVLGMGSDCVLF